MKRVPGSRKSPTPPTWSTCPWVTRMCVVGAWLTASKLRLCVSASKPSPVLMITRPPSVSTMYAFDVPGDM